MKNLHVLYLATIMAGGLLLAGCANQKSDVSGRNRVIQDLVNRVVCIYPLSMWQSFDVEGDRDPEGFKATVYLLSAKTGKGILVNGTLHVKMYRIDEDDNGKAKRTLVQSWSTPTNELPHTTEPAAPGYAYAPSFYWGDANVYGHEVEIMMQYEAPSGRMIQSQTTRRKVPSKKD